MQNNLLRVELFHAYNILSENYRSRPYQAIIPGAPPTLVKVQGYWSLLVHLTISGNRTQAGIKINDSACSSSLYRWFTLNKVRISVFVKGRSVWTRHGLEEFARHVLHASVHGFQNIPIQRSSLVPVSIP